MNSSRPQLIIFTALTATTGHCDGTFVLTRKFIEGVMEYVKSWPGMISVWVQRDQRADNNLDHVEVHPDDLPFRLNWLEGDDETRFYAGFDEADVVLAALVPQHIGLADLSVARNIPLTYITEYSVLTRRQIVRAETRNPLLRWRREHWAVGTEKRYRRSVSLAAGIQCNGLPTFTAYKELNRRCLLFFDTRVRTNQLVGADKLDQRLVALRNGEPLRLGFSGRLIAIKGVDHLPLVARELLRLGVSFTLDICGGGELEPTIRKDIQRFGLENHVRMRGVLDFESELLPFVAGNIDLFVCCHRQGDPSCTYLETYSCGVPIVGYANEAFSGLAEISEVGGAGWATTMDAPILLARKIADLNARREEILIASRNALTFAELHTFDKTMAKRVRHLLECHPDQAEKSHAYN